MAQAARGAKAAPRTAATHAKVNAARTTLRLATNMIRADLLKLTTGGGRGGRRRKPRYAEDLENLSDPRHYWLVACAGEIGTRLPGHNLTERQLEY
jgi:hypothetical protein